ncbi:MAG: hypothetical protein AAF787_15400 [Chloroflexota bacterium]
MTNHPEPRTNPGWRWFLLYVVVITAFTTLVEYGRWLAIQNVAASTTLIQVASVGGLLFYAVQGFVLPRPVSRQRGLWIVLSVGAAIAASVVFGVVLRALVFRVSNDAMSLRALGIYNQLASIIIFAVAVGTVQFLILRRHVRHAWIWYVTLLVSTTATVPANVVRNALTFADLDARIRQIILVLLTGGSALTGALLTGVVLWVLVARFQKNTPTPNDPGFRYTE